MKGFHAPSAAIVVERRSIIVLAGSEHATAGIAGFVYVAVRSGGGASWTRKIFASAFLL